MQELERTEKVEKGRERRTQESMPKFSDAECVCGVDFCPNSWRQIVRDRRVATRTTEEKREGKRNSIASVYKELTTVIRCSLEVVRANNK